jgi:hypothetical protein
MIRRHAVNATPINRYALSVLINKSNQHEFSLSPYRVKLAKIFPLLWRFDYIMEQEAVSHSSTAFKRPFCTGRRAQCRSIHAKV